MNNKLKNSNWDDNQINEIISFFSELGWYPPTWNIKQIILDCVESESILCDVKKKFLIADISDKNILSVLNAVNYDLRLLLKLNFELDNEVQLIGSDWKEEESREEEKRLDLEWEQENGREACDNCGWPTRRNHDCNSAIEGMESNEYYEEKMRIPITAGVNYFITRIINKFKPLREEWIKQGFELETERKE